MIPFLAHAATGAAIGWLVWRFSPVWLSRRKKSVLRSPEGEAG